MLTTQSYVFTLPPRRRLTRGFRVLALVCAGAFAITFLGGLFALL